MNQLSTTDMCLTRRDFTEAAPNVVVCCALAALAFSLASCASGPPLPRRAPIETATASGTATDFRETVANADIIYFPSERAASGARSEPAALLVEAMEGSGAPFAIGWDQIDATQQPILDQLASQSIKDRERVVSQLEVTGSGRAREHCRAVLDDPHPGAARQLALALADQPLAGSSEPPIGMRFNPPAAGMENFAERMTAAESLSGRDVGATYRAQVAQQQFAAAQIVRYFESGGTGKLLVFARAASLETGQGIPFYVAQKLSLRQVVLGPSSAARGKLLTDGLGGDRRLQVVDGAPGSARD